MLIPSVVLLIVPLTVAAPTPAPGSGPNEPDEVPDAARALIEDAQDKPRFVCRPRSINWSASVGFDEQGRPNQDRGQLYLQFDVVPVGNFALVAYRGLSVTKAVTDSGDDIEMQSHTNQEQVVHRRMMIAGQGHRDPHAGRLNLNLQLTPPSRRARSLEVIEGSLSVTYAGGALREAVIAPVRDFETKRIRIGGVEDSLVVITRDGQRRETIHMDFSQTTVKMLAEVRFLTPEGLPMQVNDWGGGGGDGGTVRRSFNVAMAEQGQIVLVFYSHLKTEPVSFQMRDIPLPGADRREQWDVVIEARPSGEAEPAKTPKREQLPVQVEDGA